MIEYIHDVNLTSFTFRRSNVRFITSWSKKNNNNNKNKVNNHEYLREHSNFNILQSFGFVCIWPEKLFCVLKYCTTHSKAKRERDDLPANKNNQRVNFTCKSCFNLMSSSLSGSVVSAASTWFRKTYIYMFSSQLWTVRKNTQIELNRAKNWLSWFILISFKHKKKLACLNWARYSVRFACNSLASAIFVSPNFNRVAPKLSMSRIEKQAERLLSC